VTLSGRISLARENSSLTQQQLSHRLGVLLKTVKNWETDRSEPRGNKLTTLSGVLGVSLQWLVTGKDDLGNIPDTPEETKSLQVKMDRLLTLHEQSTALIAIIQADIQNLQGRIDDEEL
jgi:HTH-type transcriptional regulator, cell division transcriptional repressor